TITAGGKVDAPLAQRVFWAIFEGLVAIALLLGGGLGALQAASVSTGLPFAVVLLLGCIALVKGLLSEPRPGKAAARSGASAGESSPAVAAGAPESAHRRRGLDGPVASAHGRRRGALPSCAGPGPGRSGFVGGRAGVRRP